MALSLTTITAPVLSTTGESNGGSLTASTTYYYTVIALSSWTANYQYIGSERCVAWSPPSNEVSVTTTVTDLTANLSWTIPAEFSGWDSASYGFFICRSTVSGAYTQKIRYSTRASYTYIGTTIADDGTATMDNCFYPLYGHSRLVIPDTGIDQDDIYDWMIANGGTNNIQRIADECGGAAQSWIYKFSMYLTSTADVVFHPDFSLTHQGTIWTDAGSSLQFGSSTSNTQSSTYSYNWVSAYWSPRGTIKVYNTRMSMGNNYGGLTGEAAHSNANLYYTNSSKVLYEYSLWDDKFPGEMSASTKGYAKNSIITNCTGMFPSSSLFTDNLIIKNSIYAFYGNYGGAFMGMRNIDFKSISSTGLLFHKNTTPGVMHAVNITLPSSQEPPVANYINNRENFSVLRKFEFSLKVIDSDGNAIENATVSIKDNADTEVYSLITDSQGDSIFAKNTATSGSTTTLVDTSQSWDVNQLQYHIVDITGGTGSGQGAWIASNTADTITFYGELETAIANGSQYLVTPQLIKEKYSCDPSPATYDLTSYNPFLLSISKVGYDTYEMQMTLNKKFDGILTLEATSKGPVGRVGGVLVR